MSQWLPLQGFSPGVSSVECWSLLLLRHGDSGDGNDYASQSSDGAHASWHEKASCSTPDCANTIFVDNPSKSKNMQPVYLYCGNLVNRWSCALCFLAFVNSASSQLSWVHVDWQWIIKNSHLSLIKQCVWVLLCLFYISLYFAMSIGHLGNGEHSVKRWSGEQVAGTFLVFVRCVWLHVYGAVPQPRLFDWQTDVELSLWLGCASSWWKRSVEQIWWKDAQRNRSQAGGGSYCWPGASPTQPSLLLSFTMSPALLKCFLTSITGFALEWTCKIKLWFLDCLMRMWSFSGISVGELWGRDSALCVPLCFTLLDGRAASICGRRGTPPDRTAPPTKCLSLQPCALKADACCDLMTV